MSLLRSRGIVVAMIGALFVLSNCTPPPTVQINDPQAGQEPPDGNGNDNGGGGGRDIEILLQASRSRVIRNDDNQGSVTFEANATSTVNFRWCALLVDEDDPITESTIAEQCTQDCDIDSVGGLLDAECNNLTGVERSFLIVNEVISDPNIFGKEVFVFVFAEPDMCNQSDGDCSVRSVTSLSVVRPSGSLRADGQSQTGSTANPGESVRFIVDVEGGDPGLFEVPPCDTLGDEPDDGAQVGGLVASLPLQARPYSVTWSVSPQLTIPQAVLDGLEEGPGSDEERLFDQTNAFRNVLPLCNNDGETRTQIDFVVPRGVVGELTFTVVATDAAGNSVSTAVDLSVRSARALTIDDLGAGSTELLPEQSTVVEVDVDGGECPYQVSFSLPSNAGGELRLGDATSCVDALIEDGVFVCTVGGTSIEDCSADGTASVEYVAAQSPTTETITVNVIDAVGASVRETISIATTAAIAITARADNAVIAPGSDNPITATISGGEPPYTIRFGASEAATELRNGVLVREVGDCPGDNSTGSPDPTGAVACASNAIACQTVAALGTDGTASVERIYCAAGNKVGQERITISVTDGNGATATTTVNFTVAVEEELTVNLIPAKTTLGFNEQIILRAEASGGIPPYTFSFDATDGTISDRTAANEKNYTAPPPPTISSPTVSVTVTDSANGEATDSETLFVSQSGQQGGPLNLSVSTASENICTGTVRSVVASASGGVPPYAFTFTCDDCDDADPLKGKIAGSNYTAPSELNANDDPFANVITVTVTDSQNVQVNNQQSPLTFTTVQEPPIAGVDNAIVNSVCEGDTITLDGMTDAARTTGCSWSCGDGTFSPVQPALDTVYTPGADDVTAGEVTCTLTCPPIAPCAGDAVFNDTIDIVTVASCSGANDCQECVAGVCQNAGAGTACGDATDDECTNPDTCDGAGTCLDNDEANGVACGDPTVTECDLADTCDGAGACQDNLVGAGTNCGDGPSANGCSGQDTCNGAGACLVNHFVVGTACGSNANTQCTDPDSCDGAGSCLDNHVNAGEPCGNQTDNDCTDPDTCNGAGACAPNHALAGTACPDGLFCNGDEECDGGGICGLGIPPFCPPDVCNEVLDACTECAVNADCGVGEVCDVTGSCVACIVDGDCDDGNECTDDSCLAGACVNDPVPNGTACGSDTDTECDNPDTCDGAGTCQDNLEANGFACGDPTDTECDAADTCDGVGVCQDNLAGAGANCGDGPTACSGQDTCNGAGACQPNHFAPATPCGSPVNDQCTLADTCNGSGVCLENNFADGLPCGSNVDTECNNPDECVAGVCDPQFEPNGTACGSGVDSDCTDPDTCDGAGACQPNDAAVGSACDDGSHCDGANGTDTCDGTGVCNPGTVPDCDDGVACTDDSCNEGTDSCDNVANDGNCDNGDFCDGDETCDVVLGCQPGVAVDCDDGVACTDDSCNEGTDSCDNVPDDANCDNGLFCDGDETCDAVLDCQAGIPPACPEVCNETLGACTECEFDADCPVGETCDVTGTCVP